MRADLESRLYRPGVAISTAAGREGVLSQALVVDKATLLYKHCQVGLGSGDLRISGFLSNRLLFLELPLRLRTLICKWLVCRASSNSLPPPQVTTKVCASDAAAPGQGHLFPVTHTCRTCAGVPVHCVYVVRAVCLWLFCRLFCLLHSIIKFHSSNKVNARGARQATCSAGCLSRLRNTL